MPGGIAGSGMSRQFGKVAAASSTRARMSGSASRDPREAHLHVARRDRRHRVHLGRQRGHHPHAVPHRARHRPDVSKLGDKREAAVHRHEPERRSKPTMPQNAAWAADRAGGVGAQRRVGHAARRARPRTRRWSRPRSGPARSGWEPSRSEGSPRSCRTRTRAGSPCRRRRSPPARAARPPPRSSPGRGPRRSAEPYVVRMPAVSRMSLTARRGALRRVVDLRDEDVV